MGLIGYAIGSGISAFGRQVTRKKSDRAVKMSDLLETMRREVAQKAKCWPLKEGLFRAVLKASFVRIYEYADFVNLKLSEEGPVCFFGAAPLRQCCEDLIALKFLMQLKRKDRDAVIQALMIINTGKASEKQSLFFKLNHPYQSILTSTFPADQIDSAKQDLNQIGARTQLWHTHNKLPPIEQMAKQVGFSNLYEFLYAATSEIVHFNVRISLRSGWGAGNKEFSFSPSNFSRYYQRFARTYSSYLLFTYCRTFGPALKLSPDFMNSIDAIEVLIQSEMRWPEIVTFEEMNIPPNDNIILEAILAMKQNELVEKLRSKHAKRRDRRTRIPNKPLG